MKRHQAVCAALFVAVGACGTAAAGTVYWDGTGTGWEAAGNWSTGSGATTPDPETAPGAADDVVFNISTLNTAQTVQLNGDQSAKSVTNSTTGAVTVLGGGADRTLTLGSGGLARTGNAATVIGSPTSGQRVDLVVGADQTWLNSIAGSDIVISNAVTAAATGDAATTNVLTLNAANKGFLFAGNGNTVALRDGAAGRRLSLVKLGSGAVTLNSTNTYSGGTVINAGTVILTATNALGSGPVVMAGGTIQHNVGTTLTNDLVAQAGTTSVLQGNSSGALVLSGNITGSGNLTAAAWVNYGSPQLSGNNSGFSGRFTVNWSNAMRMKFNSPESGSSNAWWELNGPTSDGNSLTFSGGTIYFGAMNGAGQMRSPAGNTIVVGGLNTNCTYSGNFNGANLVIRKVGTAAFALTSAANYTGGTQINGGTMVFSNATAFGSGNIAFGGGTLRHGLTFTQDLSAKIVNSTADIAVDDGGQSVTYATALAASNKGGLTKKGVGTLTLAVQPAYTGLTTVAAGTLAFGTSVALPGGAAVSNGATLSVSGGLTAGPLTLADGATLTAVGSITGGVVTVGTGASIRIAKATSWPLTGTFEIMSYTAAGASVLSDASVSVTGLSGNSEATLDFATAGKVYLTITSEKLVWSGADGDEWRAAGKWTGQNSGDSYTFTDYDAVLVTNGAAAGTPSIAVNVSDVTPSSATFDLGAGFSRKLAGAYGIAGAATSLTKSGDGALILANANSYAGATAVNGGELVLGDGAANGSIGSGTPVSVSAGAAFVVNSASGTSQSVANAVSGAGTLVKRGAGTLTLNGRTAFSERIAVEAGTLRFNPAANFNLSAVMTNAGGVEQVAKVIVITNSALVAGLSGTWTIPAGAEVRFPGDYSGVNYFGNLSEMRLAGGKIGLNDLIFNVTVVAPLRAVDGTASSVEGVEANFALSGSLRGTGTINAYSNKRGIMLNGDNGAFEGTFAFQTGGGSWNTCGFFATNACGTNAVWNLNYNTASDRAGAVHSLRFDVGGTYRLGALNTVAGSRVYCRTGTDGTPSVYNTVLEVGQKGVDCSLEGLFVKNRFALNKVGSARLTLGSGFDCPAGTAISALSGTLAVNAPLTNATVTAAAGARIEGVGALGNALAWGDGVTVAPGTNGVGTLTLQASPVVTSGAVWAANVSSNGTCSVLSVKGGLDLSSLTLQLQDPAQLNKALSYVVATTESGTLSGQIAASNLPPGWTARNEGTAVRLVKVPSGTMIKIY